MGMTIKVVDANGDKVKLNNYVKRAKSGRYLGRVIEINPLTAMLRIETNRENVLIEARDVKLS